VAGRSESVNKKQFNKSFYGNLFYIKKTEVMKTIKFLKSSFMPVVAIVTAGLTMSFEMAEKADTTYYYNSTDTSANAFADAGHWMVGDPEEQDCFEEGNRPCRIDVPQNQTLSSMLAGKDNAQVLNIAQGRKP